ncbi:hypothetical protein BDN72DRAFT_918884 [Pluteus cervinus]|uniref:Uncharacterized protein n=1 Tax=Pluteus cervinus TaxID=181527 RepID=A0ACD3AKE9_9AGAR|nr:hypothetical protein BDN72DRAFT_918884 [Pluteus cervinus]
MGKVASQPRRLGYVYLFPSHGRLWPECINMYRTSDLLIYSSPLLPNMDAKHILDLPPEIISSILTAVLGGGFLVDTSNAAGVCRYFRSAALDTPWLWCIVGPRRPRDCVVEWLKRSKAVPLTVYRHVRCDDDLSTLALILKHLHRIQHLSVHVQDRFWPGISALFSKALTRGSLGVSPTGEHAPMLKLEEFELGPLAEKGDPRVPSFIRPSFIPSLREFPELTSLSLTDLTPELRILWCDLLQVMQCLPRLEELLLVEALAEPYETQTVPLPNRIMISSAFVELYVEDEFAYVSGLRLLESVQFSGGIVNVSLVSKESNPATLDGTEDARSRHNDIYAAYNRAHGGIYTVLIHEITITYATNWIGSLDFRAVLSRTQEVDSKAQPFLTVELPCRAELDADGLFIIPRVCSELALDLLFLPVTVGFSMVTNIPFTSEAQ